jgi:hypothetical protein
MQDLGAADGVSVRVPKAFERIDLMAVTLADAARRPSAWHDARHVRHALLARETRMSHRYPQGPIRRQSRRKIL